MGNILEALQTEHDRLVAEAIKPWAEDLALSEQERIALAETITGLTAEREQLGAENNDLRTIVDNLNDDVSDLETLVVSLRAEIERLKAGSEPTPHFTMLAHFEGRGAQVAARFAERKWATGVFFYNPANSAGPTNYSHLAWDAGWDALVAAYPEGIDITISPKSINLTALEDWCKRLPAAWRSKALFAYYQEPEDDIYKDGNTGAFPARVENYRANVKAAAAVVRKYGIKNGVEIQEYTLDPSNPWGGEARLAALLNPADIDMVSWSMFEFNLKPRSDAQMKRIEAFMAKYLPNTPWEIGAAGISVPGGNALGSPERKLRADLAQAQIDRVRASKAKGYAWFDFASFTSKDFGVANDPLLKAVFEKNFG